MDPPLFLAPRTAQKQFVIFLQGCWLLAFLPVGIQRVFAFQFPVLFPDILALDFVRVANPVLYPLAERMGQQPVQERREAPPVHVCRGQINSILPLKRRDNGRSVRVNARLFI